MRDHLTTALLFLVLACGPVTGCDREASNQTPAPKADVGRESETGHEPANKPASLAADEAKPPDQELETRPRPPLVTAANKQIGVTVIYDGAYAGLSYPGGDVPIERGVCTDVVIRALRDAYEIDLQQLVHEDMKANFDRYPSNWGLTRPDRNIDHRRVPNLQTFFKRRGWKIQSQGSQADYIPGDLVTCMVGNLPHIMIVSDLSGSSGKPLVIHNIGRGTVEEDRLCAFTITGHYRIKRLENTEN